MHQTPSPISSKLSRDPAPSETKDGAKPNAKPQAKSLALTLQMELFTFVTPHLQQKLKRQATLTSIHIMAFAWKAAGLSYASIVIGGIFS
jgi:hypothetical protein